MQSKTLTIIFADIQGFTSRTSRQTREENETFIGELSQFVRSHTERFGGVLVKTMGDGFLITFESPTNAVNCGLSMQREMEKRNANILESENFVKFRIGISTGEVNIDDHNDVYGEAVNIAARIEKFADPNGVFISESTYLAMNKVEVKAQDLGLKQFKNVLREIRVYKVLKGEGDFTAKMSGRNTSRVRKIVLAATAVGLMVGAVYLGTRIGKEKPDTISQNGIKPPSFSEIQKKLEPLNGLEREMKSMTSQVLLLERMSQWPKEGPKKEMTP